MGATVVVLQKWDLEEFLLSYGDCRDLDMHELFIFFCRSIAVTHCEDLFTEDSRTVEDVNTRSLGKLLLDKEFL
jgi:hypothetical protein